jgi:hypothetical protein
MNDDQDDSVGVYSHPNPSILVPTMLFIKYGDGMRITKDRRCSFEAHVMFHKVLYRFYRAPLKIVTQRRPRVSKLLSGFGAPSWDKASLNAEAPIRCRTCLRTNINHLDFDLFVRQKIHQVETILVLERVFSMQNAEKQ